MNDIKLSLAAAFFLYFLLLRIRNKKIFVGDLVAIFNVIHNFIHKTAVLVDNYWE